MAKNDNSDAKGVGFIELYDGDPLISIHVYAFAKSLVQPYC